MLLFGMLNVVGMYRCEEVMETHLSFRSIWSEPAILLCVESGVRNLGWLSVLRKYIFTPMVV